MANRGILTTVVLLGLLLAVPAAFAAPGAHLDWGAQLHSGDAACAPGTLVVNVTQKVTNDADSGVAGNVWAFDDIVRHIQVVQTGASTFCATVSYEGNFTTNAGPSPNNTGTVDAGVVGTFQGGYVSVPFIAVFTPTTRTRGNNGAGAPFGFAWWGWIYHAGNNGTWVNASSGNTGDITGE